MTQHQQDQPGEPAGLFAGLAGIGRNALGLFITRIELAAAELGEMRARLIALLVLGVGAAILAAFALAAWSVLIVVLAWPTMGWTILAVLAVVFTLAAVLLFNRARAIIEQGGLSMPVTMSELRTDRDALL